MKKYYILFAGFVVSAMLVACGSNSNSPEPTISCPAGYNFQNGYCVGANGIANTGSIGFYSESWNSSKLSQRQGFNEFLKNAMGVCDRKNEGGTYGSCSEWMSGRIDIVMQAPSAQSQTVQVTFRAAPRPNNGPQYRYKYPTGGQLAGMLLGWPVPDVSGAVRNPLQLNMTVSVINNYKGFEADGYGDFYTKANRSLIQIQVGQGKLEDGTLEYRLAYRGQIIANGRFIRCSSADCGLSRPITSY
jgi:hypothetical protein